MAESPGSPQGKELANGEWTTVRQRYYQPTYPLKTREFLGFRMVYTRDPKTNSKFTVYPLKIGRFFTPQKETRKYSNHPFSGANC